VVQVNDVQMVAISDYGGRFRFIEQDAIRVLDSDEFAIVQA
jgi:hypothetical protein